MNANLLDQLPDAVIATDASGTITTWNPAAVRLLGFTAEQAIGQTLALIIPADHRPAHIAGFHRAMTTGTLDSHGKPVLVSATDAAGNIVNLEMTLAVAQLPDGTPSGAIATLRPAGHRPILTDFQPQED